MCLVDFYKTCFWSYSPGQWLLWCRIYFNTFRCFYSGSCTSLLSLSTKKTPLNSSTASTELSQSHYFNLYVNKPTEAERWENWGPPCKQSQLEMWPSTAWQDSAATCSRQRFGLCILSKTDRCQPFKTLKAVNTFPFATNYLPEALHSILISQNLSAWFYHITSGPL